MTSSGKISGDNSAVSRVNKALLYFIVIGFCAFTTFPFVWMLLASVKPLEEIFGRNFLPINPTLENFKNLFTQMNALRAFFNSAFIAVTSTGLSVLFCSLGGFGFSKYNFKGKSFLFSLMIGTMTIPFVVGLVPTFIMMRNTFHWIDTPLPLIVPGLANAFGIYFMRQYMDGVPNELLEAARIDGANEITIFWRVVTPVVVPAMASLGIIFFMASWNNFLWPSIVLRTPDNFTLPVMIASLQGSAGRTPYDLMMAGSVLSVIPMLIVFFGLQRYFYAGITAGGVKG